VWRSRCGRVTVRWPPMREILAQVFTGRKVAVSARSKQATKTPPKRNQNASQIQQTKVLWHSRCLAGS
jgi:hypothetical protein